MDWRGDWGRGMVEGKEDVWGAMIYDGYGC